MLACQHVLTTFIGELDGQPVGFACLRLIPHLQGDEPYAELTDIYVDALFRRHGVARALIAHLEAAPAGRPSSVPSTPVPWGDFDRSPIADTVLAMHLVANGGKHYWIEAVSNDRPQLTDDHDEH